MELKPLRSIDRKNMKVTFYLSEVLYSEYKNIQKIARESGYKVDFNHDFTTWFTQQLEDAKNAIGNIKKK
jgi:hypothetical protein